MSSLITANNVNDLYTKSASTLFHMDEWFTVNGLSLNLDKTIVIHYSSNHLQDSTVQISYQGNVYMYACIYVHYWIVFTRTCRKHVKMHPAALESCDEFLKQNVTHCVPCYRDPSWLERLEL